MDSFIPFLTLTVFLILYFLPSIIANRRGHNNVAAILMLNLFLGWTCIGWIVAIVWAMTDNRKVASHVAIQESPATCPITGCRL